MVTQDYQRHGTKQADKVLEFLEHLEQTYSLTPYHDKVFVTGSGATMIAPLIGAKMVQEVVAVAVAVGNLHPKVRFVSEIGGEDMKTIFFPEKRGEGNKQVFMQNVCSGGTGTFIEKTARKLGVIDNLSEMTYTGYTPHKISSKCGIFAEADCNTLIKSGVSIEEIIASLFEAVVYQNLSTLTKGNTPLPEVVLLGGPNLFYIGLQQAWRVHLEKLWKERKVLIPAVNNHEALIVVPEQAVFYAALGCVELARRESEEAGLYLGSERLLWWVKEGQYEEKKKEGKRGLVASLQELEKFMQQYGHNIIDETRDHSHSSFLDSHTEQVFIGCDFGSTTAKAVCVSPKNEISLTFYSPSNGNPIQDARSLFRQISDAGVEDVCGIGLTGYGAELIGQIIGADVSLVETVAHAVAGLHFFADADCICDVGGTDVKIMLMKNGVVSDFRLNSQCSSGNGAFLQGVAERFNIPLEDVAERAFQATAIPQLTMGCGVFLQSDIVNLQRKGWNADEILAGLCHILPKNVWVYAGGLNSLAAVGKRFILQGGTHRNLAVVKAQVDFIQSKISDAEIVVHPFSGEAGALGAALCAVDQHQATNETRFKGFDFIQSLNYQTTTSLETICHWCPVNCQRTFIDVMVPGGKGRPWSKVPLAPGWERVITNHSCPKGLVEDVNELKIIKGAMEKKKDAYPNIGEMVRQEAFQ